MIAKAACAAVCLTAVGAMTALGVTGRLEPIVEKYVFGGLPACEFADLLRGPPECQFVELLDTTPPIGGHWPAINPAMRAAFDKAARATLYDEGCRCLIWFDFVGTVRRTPWPPTDDERRSIMVSTGLNPFNRPWLPPSPRKPAPGI